MPYQTHIYTHVIVDGKKGAQAQFVETITEGKSIDTRIAYWKNRAKNWNEAENAAALADPSHKPLIVSEDFGALTTLSNGLSAFGAKFVFPTK